MAINSRQILDRLCALWGVSTYKELAHVLKIGESTPSSWAKTGNIPFKLCIETVEKYGCSLDELVFGKKTQTVSDQVILSAVSKGLADAQELQLIPELNDTIAGAVAILTVKAYKEKADQDLEDDEIH